jgi:hypothetical protein
MTQCHRCGVSITFDPDLINKKSGKKIPIDRQTERPHDCPKRETKHYRNCKRCGFEIYFDDRTNYTICSLSYRIYCKRE